MVRAVIFDMDGVLIDTEKWLVKYWCQAARELGFPMEREHALAIRSLAGEYAKAYLTGVFGERFDYRKVRERRKELMENHIMRHGVEKKQGVDEILDYLKGKKIKTAVATATDPERAKKYLMEIGAYDKFDQVICASMVARGKPNPDIYLHACLQIGEKPQDCVAAEDSPNGVQAAVSAGLRTVMVPDLTEPDAKTAALIAAKARSLHDLIPLIEDWLSEG